MISSLVSYVVRNEVGWVRIRSRPPRSMDLQEIAVSERVVDAG